MNEPTKAEIESGLKVVMAVAEAIRDAGSVGIPSGHLYAMLMGHGISLTNYQTIIRTLKNAGIVKEESSLLTYISKR